MKRLLAYLFIVLGLGLVVNVNVEAKTYYCVNKALDENHMLPGGDYSLKSMLKKYKNKPLIVAAQFYQRFFKKKDLWNCGKKTHGFRLVSEKEYLKGEKELLIRLARLALPNKKVVKKNTVNSKGKTKIDLSFCKVSDHNMFAVLTGNFSNDCSWNAGNKITYNDFLQKAYWLKHICYNTRTKKVQSRQSPCVKDLGHSKVFFENGSFYYTSTETQIAKKEPSQTQEVENDKIIVTCRTNSDYVRLIRYDNLKDFRNSKENKDICNKIVEKSKNLKLYNKLESKIFAGNIRDLDINTYISITKLYDETTLTVKKEPSQTQEVAKKKEKKKEKKKVAKVVEQEQEEIKIKTKKLDTTGPEIEIAEAITVDDSSYSLKGKVSDKGSDKIYIKVDGQDIPVKKGKFKINRYSPVDEEVKIVAIDQWGNKSTKVVKVTIDIQEETIVQKLEPLNPSRVRAKTSGEKVALIIGIENYTEAPKANYANLDAKYFFDYARKAFGVKKQNINLLIDDKATLGSINKVLFKWLVGKIKPNQTDLIIFFAGHGLASNDGKELYFLPQDADPDLLSIMALSRTKLFEQIIKLKPKSVTMFLDTCYSGVSRDEQMLLASARPIRIVADEQEGIPDNFTIFSATEIDQISSGLKEAKHGIFSYYLMKGLEGKADSNKDYKITNGELLAYMDLNVSQKAAELGRQQNPSLTGDLDQVLMRYR